MLGSKTIAALIVAAGRGMRVGDAGDRPKQYLPVGGVPVLTRTLAAFVDHPRIDVVQTVIHTDDRALYEAAISETPKLRPPTPGGATRQDSVRLGLRALQDEAPDFVLIHDAARPFVDAASIDRLIDALQTADAAICALPVVDTLKTTDDDRIIAKTVSRDGLWAAQTPQGFRYERILDAHQQAEARAVTGLTDDAAAAEWAGLPVALVAGGVDNFKITTAADLDRAERLVATSHQVKPAMETRIGNGFDVHAFTAGDHVMLGGIKIDHDRGLSGHSDADVVLHALTDALFGALGSGDIGSHFPPSDPQWHGAASRIFLEAAVRQVEERGGRIVNIDLTVICERPKVGPHRAVMRETIADICSMGPARVSVKATTTERLGFAGRGEGIAAMATVAIALPADPADTSD